MKNLAEFKRTVKPGMVVEITNFLISAEPETRIVKQVKSNSLVTLKEISMSEHTDLLRKGYYTSNFETIDNRIYVTRHTDFQKATHTKMIDNGIELLTYETDYGTVAPSLDFAVGTPWLKIVLK